MPQQQPPDSSKASAVPAGPNPGIGEKIRNLFARKDKWEKRVSIRQHDLTDCGAASLASVAAHHGLRLPIARIRQLASTDQKGTNILGLVEAASQIGFTAKAVRGPFESIYSLPFPSIAHVVVGGRLHHYVVVYGADERRGIQVMDPAHGTVEWVSAEEFGKIWSGIALLLAPLEEFEQGDETVPVLTRFSYLLRPHRSMLIQIMIGAMFYTVLGLATSIYLTKIIDNVLPDGNQNLLNLLSLIMVAILLIQIFINRTKTILTMQTGQQIDARLILGYYKHLLRLPQTFFDTMRTGEIISRMNDAVKIRQFINDVLIALAVNIFILFFSFFMMFSSYWKLAMVLFMMVPLYGVVYFISNKLNKRTQRKLMEDSADLQSQLVESVNAIGTIKRFGLEDYSNVRLENRFIKLLRTVFQSANNSLISSNASSLISGGFVIVLLWAGATFVLSGALTAGELLGFYALVGYFTGPVVGLIGMNKTMQDALIAADRLFEIMDLEHESVDGTNRITREQIGDITFKNVAFRYGTRANVFESLDLTLPACKVTAVVGESGSGKTTLLSLLQNLYPLQAGSIHIGSTDIKYVTAESLRQLVSVVPQQVDLFSGTVVENIAIGEFEPDMKRVVELCEELGILSFIEALPSGFNTVLGENGTNLSGGQRQRLSIARALYRDPEILILDEATSALDSLSELKIQEAVQRLRERGKTVLLIAHRLSTVVNADKIVVMNKGEVIEEGGHDELLNAEGAYYTMWEQQFPMIKQLLGKEPAPRKKARSLDPSTTRPARTEGDNLRELPRPGSQSDGEGQRQAAKGPGEG